MEAVIEATVGKLRALERTKVELETRLRAVDLVAQLAGMEAWGKLLEELRKYTDKAHKSLLCNELSPYEMGKYQGILAFADILIDLTSESSDAKEKLTKQLGDLDKRLSNLYQSHGLQRADLEKMEQFSWRKRLLSQS